MYNLLKISLLVSFFGGLMSCVTQKTVTNLPQNTNFNDDLSKYRIKFDESTLKITNVEGKNQLPPSASLNPPLYSMNEQLDTLTERIAEGNRTFTIKGYRVQAFSGLQRKEAEIIIADLKKLMPDKTVDLEYAQPNYKVKVGSFLNRIDAYNTYYRIREVYPNVSLIYEKIKVPRYR